MRNPGGSQEGSSAFFTEKYGRQVLRQLKPETIGYVSPTSIETPEKFNIIGKNETDNIRKLEFLNGQQIVILESRMRPNVKISTASGTGFLGSEEGLIDILASDNEQVVQMGTTHQQLAEFLRYFDLASAYATKELGTTPQAFEWNNKTVIFGKSTNGGYIDSPFKDGTKSSEEFQIICLEDGSNLRFSGLQIDLIERYGFYEGVQAPHRIDPLKIARAAGIVEIPDTDPVKTIVRDQSAQATLNSADELERLSTVISIKDFIKDPEHLTFEPQDLLSILTAANLWGSDEIRQLFQSIQLNNIEPGTFHPGDFFGKFGPEGIEYIADIIPKEYPELAPGVVKAIAKIEKRSDAYKREYDYLLQQLNAGLSLKDERRKYLEDLLAKVV